MGALRGPRCWFWVKSASDEQEGDLATAGAGEEDINRRRLIHLAMSVNPRRAKCDEDAGGGEKILSAFRQGSVHAI